MLHSFRAMSGRNIDRSLEDIAGEERDLYRKKRGPKLGGGRGGPERRGRGRGRGRGGRGGRGGAQYERNLPRFTRVPYSLSLLVSRSLLWKSGRV